MNAHKPITAKAIPLCLGKPAGVPVSSPIAGASAVVIADASKISPRDFLDAFTGDTLAKREARRLEDRQRCIRAIRRGDTHGFPPMMVAECKRLMQEQAEEDASLTFVERISPTRVAL